MTEGIIPEQTVYPAFNPFTYKEVNYLYIHSNAGCLATFIRGGALSFSCNTYPTLSLDGKKAENFQDIIYNNVWLVPYLLDLGFITRVLTYDFYLWNSYFDQTITLNEIVFYGNLDGVTTSIGELPQDFLPTQEKSGVLEVSLKGSPLLDGDVVCNFDIADCHLHITGSRVLPAGFLVHAERMRISYVIKNVKSVTARLREYRRALVDDVKRRISYVINVTDTKTRGMFENTIRFSWQDKVIGVIILVERMTPTGVSNLQGHNTITVQEDINKLFNAQRMKFIGIYNRETKEFEIEEIDSIELPNTINLKDPVVESFPSEVSDIYPLFLCYLEEFEETFKDIYRTQYFISFREVQ